MGMSGELPLAHVLGSSCLDSTKANHDIVLRNSGFERRGAEAARSN
jgi:hypothetical protein